MVYEAYAHELRSQAVPPERLAQIAYECPELHAQIAAHPNAYPELLVWIEQAAAVSAAAATPAETAAPATATPAETATPATAPAPQQQLSRGARTRALLTGAGIGVVAGGIVSAVLLIWVLPGVFGSIVG